MTVRKTLKQVTYSSCCFRTVLTKNHDILLMATWKKHHCIRKMTFENNIHIDSQPLLIGKTHRDDGRTGKVENGVGDKCQCHSNVTVTYKLGLRGMQAQGRHVCCVMCNKCKTSLARQGKNPAVRKMEENLTRKMNNSQDKSLSSSREGLQYTTTLSLRRSESTHTSINYRLVSTFVAMPNGLLLCLIGGSTEYWAL